MNDIIYSPIINENSNLIDNLMDTGYVKDQIDSLVLDLGMSAERAKELIYRILKLLNEYEEIPLDEILLPLEGFLSDAY